MQGMTSNAAVWQIAVAILVFLVVYFLIIIEKVNRIFVVWVGVLLMLATGIIHFQPTFWKYLYGKPILLFASLMIFSNLLNRSGFFQYIGVKIVQLAKGNPLRILILGAFVIALSSSLWGSVSGILFFVPFFLSVSRLLNLRAAPFLFTAILAANIGGAATLIGSMPNMMVGTAAELSFNAFLLFVGPVAVVMLAVSLLWIMKLYGTELKSGETNPTEWANLIAAESIADLGLMKKSLLVLGVVFGGFLLHPLLKIEPAYLAIGGAMVLLLLTYKQHNIRTLPQLMDWRALLFIAGLFTLAAGLVDVGLVHRLAMGILEITGGNLSFTAMLLLWTSGVVSATVDQLPFATLVIPIVENMAEHMNVTHTQMNVIWWSLVLGLGLGANGTLAGASANLVAAGMAAENKQSLSFFEFLKVGLPLTLVSLLISSLYVGFVLLSG